MVRLHLLVLFFFPFFYSCATSESGAILLKSPDSAFFSRERNIIGECQNGKQITQIYIKNHGFEREVLGSPQYWKYGIDHGWSIDSDPTYLLDPQKGAGTFNIKQHKVIVFNVEDSGDNVVFLHRGTVKIRQTLNYALKPNATYTLIVLIGNREDISFGSYRLSIFAGNDLLAKTSEPVPAKGEFLRVQLIAKTNQNTFSIGRPIIIELENTSTTSKNHRVKTQVAADNFELYEEASCQSST